MMIEEVETYFSKGKISEERKKELIKFIEECKDEESMDKLDEAWPSELLEPIETNIIDFEKLVNFSFDNSRIGYDFVDDYIYEF